MTKNERNHSKEKRNTYSEFPSADETVVQCLLPRMAEEDVQDLPLTRANRITEPCQVWYSEVGE